MMKVSGSISEEDIRRVREANDIVAVFGERAVLKQRGRDFWCCCPLHNEKTPSLKIDPALQLWHCFGCGEGGDVFGFIMKADDITFPEAVRKLAERVHIEIKETGHNGASSSKKARLKEICKETASFYHFQLMRNPDQAAASARAYLASRGFGGGVPNAWNLGFAPGNSALVRHLSQKGFKPNELIEANVAVSGRDGRLRDRFFNRVMFPINDIQGECVAFGGRVIGKGEPKYLNSQETPLFHKSQVLYGLDKAKAGMAATGTAVVVEGYTDVIALHEAGVTFTVATLGTSLTMQHIRALSRHVRKRIVYLFDGDSAGQRAADRALQFIDASMTPEAGRNRIELFAVTLPDNLDPAEFVAARGADALRKLIEEAQPLLAFGIERRLRAHDLTSPEGRTRALADALNVLAPIKDSLLAKDYAIQIAGRTRVREQDALELLANLPTPAVRQNDRSFQTSYAPGDLSRLSSTDRGEAASESVHLSSAERNRLRFECELLSLAAQYPLLALEHADELTSMQWHDIEHGAVAYAIVGALAEDFTADASTLMRAAAAVSPKSSGYLTAAVVPAGIDPSAKMSYLAEEIAIGDKEDELANLKRHLADAGSKPIEDTQDLFCKIVDLQQEIADLRIRHKPLS